MKISELGVKRPVTTLMVFLVVLIFGVVSYKYLAIDMMPEIEVPTVTVITTWDGASSEDVENKITRVIEQVLGSVTDLDEITSNTREGVSAVTCKFKWGTNLGEASNDIRDLLERAKRALPDDADTPMLRKFNTSNIPIIFFGITARENIGKMDEIVNDEIVDVLKRIPGVGSAEAFGGLVRQINVNINPAKLAAYGLNISDVAQRIQFDNLTLPAGSVKIGSLDYTIRVPGEFTDPEEIKSVVVKRDGDALVRLADVADVEDGYVEQNSVVEVNGRRSMVMIVQKRSGENTVEICKRVVNKMEEIQKNLPADFTVHLVGDTADNIKRSINSVTSTVLYGGIFVILTTLFFLRSLRTSLVIALSIPFSLIIAFIFMYVMGWTINIMSMSALAIAIGMVVDNAVVVLENIVSHIARGTGRKEASMFGADEVGTAVMASTLTTIVVFLPLIFIKGIAGIMMTQLGGLVTATLLASVMCALYLTPMLASLLIRAPKKGETSIRQNAIQRWSERGFERMERGFGTLLSGALKVRWLVVLFAAAVIGGTVWCFMNKIGSEFMAAEDTGEVAITYELPLATRYEVTTEVGRRIIEVVKSIVPEDEIKVMMFSAGGSGGSFGGARNSHSGSVRLRLIDADLRDTSADAYGKRITDIIRQWPEIRKCYADSGNFMNRMLMGGGAGVRVDIFGYDLDQGTEIANKVKAIAEQVEGVRDARVIQDLGQPELAVSVDREKAASVGLTMYEATTAVSTLFQGTRTTEYRAGEKGYYVMLRLDPEFRNSIEDIRRSELYIARLGKTIRLDAIADIVETTGPVSISRMNQERRIVVSFDTLGRPQGDVVAEVKARVDSEIYLPGGTSIEFGGIIEQQKETEQAMMLMILLGVVLVYMVMAAQFESFIHPFLIMFSIPFAFSGTAAVLWLTGTPLSMTAYIGIILLIGVVVNNAIVLLDYINLLRSRGEELFAAIVNSGRQRLRPVLITTLTTLLGMLPMALSTGNGAAIWRPLGLVVVGGLSVSTIVTLIIVPTLYYIVEKVRIRINGGRDKLRAVY
ncbi:MAG: efflux RND transporter permease subunit [Kiritimatiellaeota bacterium]|nr:efflux RND transporter permease subunit [Kiritimatiellota bacterium]